MPPLAPVENVSSLPPEPMETRASSEPRTVSAVVPAFRLPDSPAADPPDADPQVADPPATGPLSTDPPDTDAQTVDKPTDLSPDSHPANISTATDTAMQADVAPVTAAADTPSAVDAPVVETSVLQASPNAVTCALARLPLHNIAVSIPGFATAATATAEDVAFVRALEDTAKAERVRRRRDGVVAQSAVLVLVPSEERAVALERLLDSRDAESLRVSRYVDPGDGSGREAFEKLFSLRDVVIALASTALMATRSGALRCARVNLLVIDSAELSVPRANDVCVLMRESYRGLPASRRPRVLAIVGKDFPIEYVSPVEENLFVEFPKSSIRGESAWRGSRALGERAPEGSLADVEHLHYTTELVQEGMFGNGGQQDRRRRMFAKRREAKLLADLDYLAVEVGPLGVALYQQRMRQRHMLRDRSASQLEEARELTEVSDRSMLLGFTSKTLSLLNELQRAHASSSHHDQLMVVVYAGRPVVALALDEAICNLPAFAGVSTRVVLGDENAAKSFEKYVRGEADARGWQGAETDDESVSAFAAGEANILILASDDEDRILRAGRPIPPCPLVIRFDDSNVDPDVDGGGGRCRVVLFKMRAPSRGLKSANGVKSTSTAGPPERIVPFAGEKVIAPPGASNFLANEVQAVNRTGQTEDSSDSLLVSAEMEAEHPGSLVKSEGASVLNANEQRGLEASSILPVTASENVRAKRSLRRLGTNASETLDVADDSDGDAGDEMEDSDAYYIKPHPALLGPEGDNDEEVFLYGMVMFGASGGDEDGQDLRNENAFGSGLEDFVLVLSCKLKDRDLAVSLSEAAHMGGGARAADASGHGGILKLTFLGSLVLTLDQIALARRHTGVLFSTLSPDMNPSKFLWGNDIDGCPGSTKSKDPATSVKNLRRYLILPIQRSDRIANEGGDPMIVEAFDGSRSDTSLTTKDEAMKKYFGIYEKASALSKSRHPQFGDAVDWSRVFAMLSLHEHVTKYNRPEAKAALAADPLPVSSLASHAKGLQGKLVHSMYGKRIYLCGELQIDICPLSDMIRTKRFALNVDGTLKEDKDIGSLYKVVSTLDVTATLDTAQGQGRQGPSGDVNGLDKDGNEISDVSGGATATPTQQPGKKSGKKRNRDELVDGFLFNPARNVKKKRKFWHGRIRQSYESYYKEFYDVDIDALHQPLLAAREPIAFGVDTLLELSDGVPIIEALQNNLDGAAEAVKLVPELCREYPISPGVLFLPVALMTLERHLSVCSLRDRFASRVGVDVSVTELLQAVTSSSADPACNYERLELLGDSVLKLSSTLRLFTYSPHSSEGQMHVDRAHLICNDRLRDLALAAGLQHHLYFQKDFLEKWKAPGTERRGRALMSNSKALADVVEALCGVFFVCGSLDGNASPPVKSMDTLLAAAAEADDSDDGVIAEAGALDDLNSTEVGGDEYALFSADSVRQGYEAGYRFLEACGVFEDPEPTHTQVLLSAIHAMHPKSTPAPTEVVPRAFPRDPRLSQPPKAWAEEFGALEETLGYRFKRRHILLCALTHGSYADTLSSTTAETHTFQRLEFLGDAAADFCVVRYLFDRYPSLGPGELTDLKSNVVSNESFARISVQLGLHKYLFQNSESMTAEIDRFAQSIGADKEHGIAGGPKRSLGELAAPKVLGDIFEAVIGGILVDSGLEEVWTVCMNLLGGALATKADPANHDKHPVKQLQDLVIKVWKMSATPPHYALERNNDQRSRLKLVSVYILGKKIATGDGSSVRRAKLRAAVAACDVLRDPARHSEGARLLEQLRLLSVKKRVEARRQNHS